MITDLASNERYEDVLQGIVRSTMRAVIAGGAILALEARAGSPRKVYSEGLTESEAESLADDFLGGLGRERSIAVEVTSVRRHYGVLAIDERGGIFASQAHGTLETYAQLAAATLDAADAMEDARHQANTARVLLDLSTSLAEIVGTEEMAAKVARRCLTSSTATASPSSSTTQIGRAQATETSAWSRRSAIPMTWWLP